MLTFNTLKTFSILIPGTPVSPGRNPSTSCWGLRCPDYNLGDRHPFWSSGTILPQIRFLPHCPVSCWSGHGCLHGKMSIVDRTSSKHTVNQHIMSTQAQASTFHQNPPRNPRDGSASCHSMPAQPLSPSLLPVLSSSLGHHQFFSFLSGLIPF